MVGKRLHLRLKPDTFTALERCASRAGYRSVASLAVAILTRAVGGGDASGSPEISDEIREMFRVFTDESGHI